MAEPSSAAASLPVAADEAAHFEKRHVRDVYDSIAEHFSETRYKVLGAIFPYFVTPNAYPPTILTNDSYDGASHGQL
jgi:hypothetical protein